MMCAGMAMKRCMRVRLHWVQRQVFASFATWRSLPVKFILRATRSQLLAQATGWDAKVVTVQVVRRLSSTSDGSRRGVRGIGATKAALAAGSFLMSVGSRPLRWVRCDHLSNVGCARAALLWSTRGLPGCKRPCHADAALPFPSLGSATSLA
jgi:hypothetical protein